MWNIISYSNKSVLFCVFFFFLNCSGLHLRCLLAGELNGQISILPDYSNPSLRNRLGGGDAKKQVGETWQGSEVVGEEMEQNVLNA